MKLVLFLLLTFSFVLMATTRTSKRLKRNFSEDDMKMMKKLSLGTRVLLMRNLENFREGNRRRSKQRAVGIAAQVAKSSSSAPDNVKSALVPVDKHSVSSRDQVQDELAALTKILQLMLETASNSAGMKAQSDEIAEQYSTNKSYLVGAYMAKCDSTLNVMREAFSMVQLLSEQMTSLDHVDAYERMIILSEQLQKNCREASNKYKMAK